MTIEELQLKLKELNLRDNYLSVNGIEERNGVNMVYYAYNNSWRVYKNGDRDDYVFDVTFTQPDVAIEYIYNIAKQDAKDSWYLKSTEQE